MNRRFGVLAAFVSMGIAANAEATYSIVATEPSSGLVGSAGASCVPYEVIRIYRVRGGRGAFVAQAYFDDPAVARAEVLLDEGAKPESILTEITDEAIYPDAQRMQYGLVDVSGQAVAYTGPLALPTAEHRVVAHGESTFTLQGNVLTSRALLDRMDEALARSACDLPERLMNALEAASVSGEGDNRCTPSGIPAKSAYLDVTGEETVLRLSIPDVSPESPITALRRAFDVWREDHPCPEASVSSASSGPTTGDPSPPSSSAGCTLSPRDAPVGRFAEPSFAAFIVALGFRRVRKKSRG